MFRKRLSARKRCFIAAFLILSIGVCTAVVLWFGAGDAGSSALAYEFADGQVFTVDPADSKAYRRELERFGGKAALFADDLNRWFFSLWQGRRLAVIIAALAAVAAGGLFRCGTRYSQERENDGQE